MQFQIKKYRHTFASHGFITRNAIGIEKLHADFHHAHMRLNHPRQSHSFSNVWHIKGYTNGVSFAHGGCP